jgi:hypothetical protein
MISVAMCDVQWRMSPTAEKAIVWGGMTLIGLFVLFLVALSISGYPGL